MPSDNLENLFRENVEEVQHTAPPQFSWTPEKSWNQLQPLLPTRRRKPKASFYLGVAAGLVLALLAGLSLYRISGVRTPSVPVVASTGKLPANPTGMGLDKPKINLEKSRKLLASAGPGTSIPVKKAKANNGKEAVDEPSPMGKETMATPIDPGKDQEPVVQPGQLAAAADTQPLRIIVVLGARTLARAEALALETTAVPDSNLLAKEKPNKKKLRLRIHNPDTGLQVDTQLATIKPFQSEIGLGTRIKF